MKGVGRKHADGEGGFAVDEVPDEILIARVRDGDEGAFRDLFSRYLRVLTRFAERRLPGRMRRRVSVADVLQEAQLVAYERIADFESRGDASFRNWLMRIVEHKVMAAVRNHAQAARRAQGREVPRGGRTATGHLPGRGPTPSQVAIGRESAELARRALESLPAPYREVLSLARGERLTLREVGARMGRSPEAVRKLLDRALFRLEAEFGRLRGESLG
jgi:RNA polymerase sigma-70 factor (ECF subfamily)